MISKVLVLLSLTGRNSKITRRLSAPMGGIGELRYSVHAREFYLMGGSGIMEQQEGILTSPNLPL